MLSKELLSRVFEASVRLQSFELEIPFQGRAQRVSHGSYLDVCIEAIQNKQSLEGAGFVGFEVSSTKQARLSIHDRVENIDLISDDSPL